jgi:hypothetical protein
MNDEPRFRAYVFPGGRLRLLPTSGGFADRKLAREIEREIDRAVRDEALMRAWFSRPTRPGP